MVIRPPCHCYGKAQRGRPRPSLLAFLATRSKKYAPPPATPILQFLPPYSRRPFSRRKTGLDPPVLASTCCIRRAPREFPCSRSAVSPCRMQEHALKRVQLESPGYVYFRKMIFKRWWTRLRATLFPETLTQVEAARKSRCKSFPCNATGAAPETETRFSGSCPIQHSRGYRRPRDSSNQCARNVHQTGYNWRVNPQEVTCFQED